ncbi:unnamed protein product [Urochloa decumbens]|uniref:Factor of DNA methylation 1-5/IDN2 domain-containing protein n=1 Tax=Urochloa decumbens TaxID=240449 RepID=A0ABC9GDJ1_9POAL
MSGLLGAMASKVDFKISLLKDVMAEYSEIKHVIDGVAKEKERLQQEKERLQNEKEMLQNEKERLQNEKEMHQHEQHANGETLTAMKEDLLASKNTLTAARNAIVVSSEEISRKNSYIEFLKEKEESEAKNNQAEQQCGSVMDRIQPRGVQTRSMQNRKRPSEGPLEYGAVENEHSSQLDNRSLSPLESLENSNELMGSMDKQKRLSESDLGNDAANLVITEECPMKELVDNPYGADENENTSQLDNRSLSPLESLENSNIWNLCKELMGSMDKQKRLSERHLGNDAANLEVTEECPRKELVDNPPVGETSCVLVSEEDLEAVRDELIKGFLEIDIGGRKIGIKEMGGLNEKAFKAACLTKVPPEEVAAASYELYSSWQQQLGDLSWYPFKTVTVDGNQQEIVNVDDDKLQELKRAWGSGPHNAVVNALEEMKDYGRLSDRSIAYELWNYKEGRRATTRECVNYMSNQVKQLSVTKRRKIRSHTESEKGGLWCSGRASPPVTGRSRVQAPASAHLRAGKVVC